ncbi:MAG: OmpA family protein [Gammaproteobacteria bacterium]|nr:OmpA family protein [Gammaproteobacteria bacterium]
MRLTTSFILTLWLAVGLTLPAAQADCGSACDADKDGVVDSVDQCTDTEPGAPVTVSGCAHDSDADGVPDYRDNCPHKGQRAVDAWGCPQGREIALQGVRFEVNSAKLLKSSQQTLADAAAILRGYVHLEVEVEGHTDNQGSAEHNRRLSRLRADAVRQYLIEAGIDATQIRARGYGESRPIASNDSEAGRTLNRRVVLRILQGQVNIEAEQ